MKRLQAKKGGEIGVNGEFYEGGKFLPSTQKGKGTSRKGTGKQEIAPYKWEFAPEGMKSIYRTISAFVRIDDGIMSIGVEREVLSLNGVKILTLYYLIDLWNKGERWIREDKNI